MLPRNLFILFTIASIMLTAGCSSPQSGEGSSPIETVVYPKYIPSATPTSEPSGFLGQLVYVKDSQLFIHDLDTGEVNLIENASDYMQFPSAGAYLSVSPDNRFIAFYGADPLYGCPTYNTEENCVLTGPDGYFLVDTSTEEISLIAPYVFTNISWAQTENKFVFSTVEYDKEPFQTALKITSPEGGEPFYVTGGEFVDTYPAWSPTGEWIAFFREPSPLPGQPKCESESVVFNSCTDPDLYIIHPDGSGLTLIEKHVRVLNSMYNAPPWSPDGTRIAVITGPQAEEITIINIVTGERSSIAGLYPIIQSPLWSRDGETLLLTSQMNGSRDIIRVNLDGTGILDVSKHTSSDFYPAWSPDETAVAFVSQRSSVRKTLVIQSLMDPSKTIEFKDINTRFLPLWVKGTLP